MERSRRPGPIDAIGFEVRTLSHLIKHRVDQAMAASEDGPVTGMQGWIIGYLYDNRDRDVFQRDVQSHFAVRRSTAAGTLKLMEKNGLIRRTSVDWDARLKKLELTPKGTRVHENVIERFQEMERTLSGTLTAQEKQTFLRLCRKIKKGIEDQPPPAPAAGER